MKFKNLTFLTMMTTIVFLSGCTNSDDGQHTRLAECLTKQGVTMYGTTRCSHCQAQKELFGYEAFAKIKFVDCDKEKNTCALAGVQGYPTWKFVDGSALEGEQNFDALASKAGCSIDGSLLGISTGSLSGTGVSQSVTGEIITGNSTTGINSISLGNL